MIFRLIFLALFIAIWVLPFNALAYNECFDFKIKTLSRFTFKDPETKQVLHHGLIALRPLNSEGDGQWWAVHLQDVQISAEAGYLVDDSFYQQPFAVKRTRPGLLTEFWFPDWVETEERDKAKGLAYLLQFQSGQASSREHDMLGEYIVEYKVQKKNVVKRKTKYLNSSEIEEAIPVDIVSSEHKMVMNDLWFSHIAGEEILSFPGFDGALNLQAKQTYEIRSTDESLCSDLIFDMPDAIVHFQSMMENTQADDVKVNTERELELRKKELMLKLHAKIDLSKTATYLSEWLMQYDDVINEILSAVEAGGFSDEQEMRLLSALGLVDSENTQQLLVDLITSSATDELRQFRALRALTQGTGELSPRVREELAGLITGQSQFASDEMKGSSWMAIGTMIANRSNTDGANELKQALLTRLNVESDTVNISYLLASLGNTQDPSIIPTIAKYTADTSARVRANAATALGQMPADGGVDILETMLDFEDSPRTKFEIISALEHKPLSKKMMEKLLTAAEKDKNEEIRYASIRALGSQKNNLERIKSSLRNLLKTENSRRNFKQIVKELHRDEKVE